MIVIDGNTIRADSGNIFLSPANFCDVIVPRHPISNFSVATKGYVDSKITGLNIKKSCQVFTKNLPTFIFNGSDQLISQGTSLTMLDNYTLQINDRILYSPEIESEYAGIYVVLAIGNSWILQRSADFCIGNDIANTYTFIENGDVYRYFGFSMIARKLPIVINVTKLQFIQFSFAGMFAVKNCDNQLPGIYANANDGIHYLKNITPGPGITIENLAQELKISANPATIDHSALLNNNFGDPHGQYLFSEGRNNAQRLIGVKNGAHLGLQISGNANCDGIVQFLDTTTANAEHAAIHTLGGIRVEKNAIFGEDITFANCHGNNGILTGSLTANNVTTETLQIKSFISGENAEFRGNIAILRDLSCNNATVSSIFAQNTSYNSIHTAGGIVASSCTIDTISVANDAIVSGNLQANQITSNTISNLENINNAILFSEESIQIAEPVQFKKNIIAESVNTNEITLQHCIINANGIASNSQFAICENVFSAATITSEELTINKIVAKNEGIHIVGDIFANNSTITSYSCDIRNAIFAQCSITEKCNISKIEGLREIASDSISIISNTAHRGNFTLLGKFTSTGDAAITGRIACGAILINSIAITPIANTLSFSGSLTAINYSGNNANFANVTSETSNAKLISCQELTSSQIRANTIYSDNYNLIVDSSMQIKSNLPATDNNAALFVNGGAVICENLIVQGDSFADSYNGNKIVTGSIISNVANFEIIGSNYPNGTMQILSTTSSVKNNVGVVFLDDQSATIAGGGAIALPNGGAFFGKSAIICGIEYKNNEIFAHNHGLINFPHGIMTRNANANAITTNSLTANEIASTIINSATIQCEKLNNLQTITGENITINGDCEFANRITANNTIFASIHNNTIIGDIAQFNVINGDDMTTSINNCLLHNGEIIANSALIKNASFDTISYKNLTISGENLTISNLQTLFSGKLFCAEASFSENVQIAKNIQIAGNANIDGTITTKKILIEEIDCNNLPLVMPNFVVSQGISILSEISSNNATFANATGTNITAQNLFAKNITGNNGLYFSNENSNNNIEFDKSKIIFNGIANFQENAIIGKNLQVGHNTIIPYTNTISICNNSNHDINPADFDGIFAYSQNNAFVTHAKNKKLYHMASTITVAAMVSAPLISPQFTSSQIICTNATIDENNISLADLILINNYTPKDAYGIWKLVHKTNVQFTFEKLTNIIDGTLVIVENGKINGGSIYIKTKNNTFANVFSANDLAITSAIALGNGIVPFAMDGENILQLKSLYSSSPELLISENDGTIEFAIEKRNLNHNDFAGLSEGDPHKQYLLLNGRSPSQQISGNVNFSGNSLQFGTICAANNFVGINTTNPSCELDISGTVNVSQNVNIADTITVAKKIVLGNNNSITANNNGIIISPDANSQILCNQIPTENKSIATKEYVDSLVSGFTKKFAKLETEIVSNSTVFIKVATLVTGTIPSGHYKLSWCYCWAHSSTNSKFKLCIRTNDNRILHSHIETPTNGDLSESRAVSGFTFILLDAGNYEFYVEMASSNTTSSSKIQFVTMELVVGALVGDLRSP